MPRAQPPGRGRFSPIKDSSHDCTVTKAASAVLRLASAFLAMMPKILAHLRVAFRGLPPEARAEATQEALANTCIAFAGL